MIYKKVNMIEEEISAIGVGCWGFGGDWDTSEDQKSIDIIHAAIDMGINFFDVAPVYGWGVSETLLGKALKDGKRNHVLIASKAGLTWEKKYETQNNLSRENLFREIDESLRRLQTDHIDIYQMHWPDPNTPLEETAEALKELKKAGKIRYVGLSNFNQADVEKMMGLVEVSCQQSLYNLLERNPVSYHSIPLDYRTESEVLPTVKKYGQAFLPYSPMFQGLLAGKFLDGKRFSEQDIRSANPKLAGPQFETYMEAGRQVKAFAEEIGRPMNEVSLNWLRQKEEVTSIIGGASSIQQLERNVHSLTWDLEEDMIARLNEISAPLEWL